MEEADIEFLDNIVVAIAQHDYAQHFKFFFFFILIRNICVSVVVFKEKFGRFLFLKNFFGWANVKLTKHLLNVPRIALPNSDPDGLIFFFINNDRDRAQKMPHYKE